MKIAVTAQGESLSSQVDPRFGRAKHFIVVDTETNAFVVHSNAHNLGAVQGAGIQAGRAVVDLGVAAVITGHVGPKAFMALQAGQVKVYLGASGTIEEALERFKAGQLQLADGANVEGHW